MEGEVQMQELIKTTQDENGILLVNGRELHRYLEVKTRYNDWFVDMLSFGFAENVDFSSFTEKRVKPQGGRPSIDHALTLDMAKEISMIQRTDKGKEARRYFIEVEKQHKQQPQLPTSQRELAKLALSANEETNQRVDEVAERVTEIEENTKIDASDYGYIGRRVNQRVKEIARGYNATNKDQLATLYKDINTGVKQITGVSTRSQLRQKDFDKVNEYINNWQPSTATITIINDLRDSA